MTRMYDDTVVNQIQQANDIVDLVSEYVSLAKKGREMVGLCPFHQDHNPSLNVSPTKQIFKCYVCGAGGDVIKFVQLRENLTFPQALERLAERVGIKLQKPEHTGKKSPKEDDQIDPNRLAKANAWAASHFQKNLASEETGKSARDYLAERKISPQSVKKWGIGLAISNDDMLNAAKSQKIPVELLQQAGLITEQGHDKFVNRLMFPISDPAGRIIAFGGRTLDGHPAKYMNSPATILFDKSNSVYGLDNARHKIVETDTTVIVEGYTDVIMAHQFGCENVVAALGTSFTDGHAKMLRRYAKKLVLLFDSDKAGNDAANRAIEICLSQKIDVKITAVPEGKDPCDYLLAAGKDNFQRIIDNAEDVFKFKWRRLVENFSGQGTLADKKNIIDEFLQTIATAARSGNLSAVERGLIVNRLSNIMGLSAAEINMELRKKSVHGNTASGNLENRQVQNIDLGQGSFAIAQREIIEVLLCQPELLRSSKQEITADLFDIPIFSRIAQIIIELYEKEGKASVAAVLAIANSDEEQTVITDLVEEGEKKANFQMRLTGSLNTLNRCLMQNKLNSIETQDRHTKLLQQSTENIGKGNSHNVGMV